LEKTVVSQQEDNGFSTRRQRFLNKKTVVSQQETVADGFAKNKMDLQKNARSYIALWMV